MSTSTIHAVSTPTSLTLGDIELRAKNFASARSLLADRVLQLQDEIEAAKRKAMPLIRSALATTKAAESELQAGIQQSPGLFKKPRTHVLHGIKVGVEKGKGTVKITDPQRTVDLIHKLLTDQVDMLIKVEETPLKTALAQLPAADLRRIGVELIEAGDRVVIRAIDGELDKMLNALLKADVAEVESDELREAA